MNLGFLAQERLVRNALTVEVNRVNRTRKHAASVTAYSVLRVCPSIQCSTRSPHMVNVGRERPPKRATQPQNPLDFLCHPQLLHRKRCFLAGVSLSVRLTIPSRQ